jgi:hypothetical protein
MGAYFLSRLAPWREPLLTLYIKEGTCKIGIFSKSVLLPLQLPLFRVVTLFTPSSSQASPF